MIPPHNLQAERDSLGSAVLTRAALEHLVGTLTSEDFYDPANAAVFSAMAGIVRQGGVPDATTLASELHAAGKLDLVGGRSALLAMSADVPASMNVKAYVGLVADCAARRRLMGIAERVTNEALDPAIEIGAVVQGFQASVETVRLPVDEFVPPIDARELAEQPDEYDWIVPKLLERGDRVIWTAAEGVGKSEMQLQLAVMLAAGIHPFQRYPVRKLRVLLIDLENSKRQLGRRMKRLMGAAGSAYQGGLGVECRTQGIDLRDPRDFQWLDRHCEEHRPELLVIGPLYKTFRVRGRESKSDETAAEEAAYALDKLRARHGCAVSLEAHSPHGNQGDRDGFRPYGASLWMRWPEFGLALKQVPGEYGTVEVKQWRGARDRDRDWPEMMTQGLTWPWEPLEPRRAAA